MCSDTLSVNFILSKCEQAKALVLFFCQLSFRHRRQRLATLLGAIQAGVDCSLGQPVKNTSENDYLCLHLAVMS